MRCTPCRLYVFLAREAPTAVVLRRGPSAWAHLTVWRTRDDTFEHGQWFKGRVYEDRCDLPPDGRLFLYFAHKESARSRATGYGSAWTVLSRPPFFTALGLWPQCSTYLGGGVFRGNHRVVLHGTGPEAHPDHNPPWLKVESIRGEFVSGWSYQQRLQRGGWEVVERGVSPRAWQSVADPPSTWRRYNPQHTLAVEMAYPGHDPRLPGGFGGFAVRFAVRSQADDAQMPLDGATWADWDQRGRLVLAKEGCLFEWRQVGPSEGVLRILADFNTLQPEPLPAPAWARSRPPRDGRDRRGSRQQRG